jgi:hypothetical protein
MPLGELTKQIAQQAILSATTKEPPPPPPAQPQRENLAGSFFAQVAAMQKPLKDDEELAIHYHHGPDSIRVLEMFAPSPGVVVLTGSDSNRNLARVIAAAETLQLVCRVVKSGAKPLRVPLITPK